ncbi:MAG: hypothetical protein KGM17_04300 [Sphingomonadales bacterium]|nr:hypothetical protein [Sphingomonadales bacterium]
MLAALLMFVAAPSSAPAPAPMATSTPAPATSPDGFTIGIATIKAVVSKLGRPNYTLNSSDGSVILSYVSIRGRVKGASFIPIVGMFAGGATGKASTKTFTFGADQDLHLRRRRTAQELRQQ